jgi:D-proline reductase (dithiol) PrdB
MPLTQFRHSIQASKANHQQVYQDRNQHMTVEYITAITQRYSALGYSPYRWHYAEELPPFTPPKKPLSQARLGVLSTSGAYVAGQVAYHYKDDTSVREIPTSTPTKDIRFAHITENYLVDPRQDPNCILPIDALRRLDEEGYIGELAPALFSCMGGVYSQRRVREELIPDIAARFVEQKVDVAYLVAM